MNATVKPGTKPKHGERIVQISLGLPASRAERLRELAKSKGLSITEVGNAAIEQILQEHCY